MYTGARPTPPLSINSDILGRVLLPLWKRKFRTATPYSATHTIHAHSHPHTHTCTRVARVHGKLAYTRDAPPPVVGVGSFVSGRERKLVKRDDTATRGEHSSLSFSRARTRANGWRTRRGVRAASRAPLSIRRVSRVFRKPSPAS